MSLTWYRLTNDITLTGNWTPIGKSSVINFQGILDGNGYIISGLNISQSTQYTGLFGYTSGATIKNLTLVGDVSQTGAGAYTGAFVGYAGGSLLLENCISNVNVTGYNDVGGFVGYGKMDNSLITNCTFTGKVVGQNYVGGIIGAMYPVSSKSVESKISQCRVVVSPSSNPNNQNDIMTERVTGTDYVGGIAGLAIGIIEQCYTTVQIFGTQCVGGIIGRTLYSTSYMLSTVLQDCFSTGNIIDDPGGMAGGIIGEISPTAQSNHIITRCYSTSNVYNTSQPNTGGIAGYNGNGSTYTVISNSFAINREIRQSVTGSAITTGRICGADNIGYSNNYAKSDIPIYWNGAKQNVVGTLDNKHGQDITDAELQTSTPYQKVGWNFDNVWTMNPAVSPYPVLKWVPEFNKHKSHIELISNKTTIKVGETAQISAININVGDSVSWLNSSNIDIAAIVTNGDTASVLGITPGVVTISATTVNGDPPASVTITVVAPPPIDPDSSLAVALDIGDKCSLVGLAADNTQVDMTGYTWQSSDSSIATVSSTGKVTGVKSGWAIV